jgi:hypothetical protein
LKLKTTSSEQGKASFPIGCQIVHNNIRHKPTGREVNGPWVFNADFSQSDGIAHPASAEFRSHQGPGEPGRL